MQSAKGENVMARIYFYFLCTALCLLLAASASAQTTIYNVQSADTLAADTWNLEFDFITKPVNYNKGGYQSYGYRLAYGLTNKTEIGANFYHTRSSEPSTAQVELSVKQKVYQNEKHGVTATAGTVVTVPLKSQNGDRTGVIVYSNASKTIRQLNGMTITGGVYHVFRGSRDFGTRTGAMFAVVQPVTPRFGFVADWYTGNNKLGYASAGLNFNITKKQYLLTGYSFGNYGRGNNALAAYYGIIF
jgi:hypothetical protein